MTAAWFALGRFRARFGLVSGSGLVLRRFPAALDGGKVVGDFSGSPCTCVFSTGLRFGFLPTWGTKH